MENANTTVAPDRCALLHEPSRAGLLHILDREERWHGWIGTDLHSGRYDLVVGAHVKVQRKLRAAGAGLD